VQNTRLPAGRDARFGSVAIFGRGALRSRLSAVSPIADKSERGPICPLRAIRDQSTAKEKIAKAAISSTLTFERVF
jgi:hypothetical protein